MIQEKTDVQLITLPLKKLRKNAMNLHGYILFNKFRWFANTRDEFSWVYGLSEIEINDFVKQYCNMKDGIKTFIDNMKNERLRAKLKSDYESLPTLDPKEYTLALNKPYWILNMFRPIKTLKKSLQFKDILYEIGRTCERMINYIENVEWFELEN